MSTCPGSRRANGNGDDMKVAVIGAGGFLGAALTTAFARQGIPVHALALDRLRRRAATHLASREPGSRPGARPATI
jgi:nucleoside-diphosphate-sugar epimerase